MAESAEMLGIVVVLFCFVLFCFVLFFVLFLQFSLYRIRYKKLDSTLTDTCPMPKI